MKIATSRDEIAATEQKLVALLGSILPPDIAEQAAKAIADLIDFKIEYMRTDLEDQINKSGIYDPEY